jgi:hypothetical protein
MEIGASGIRSYMKFLYRMPWWPLFIDAKVTRPATLREAIPFLLVRLVHKQRVKGVQTELAARLARADEVWRRTGVSPDLPAGYYKASGRI